MRRIQLPIGMLILTLATFAQAPNKMSHQAVVRGSVDKFLVNKSISVQISIPQWAVGVASAYVETFSPTINVNGLVTLQIGTGTIVSGDITSIDWKNGLIL